MGTITSKISRDRVNGFLRADGRRIVNGAGEEILLTGWGLGNWLNPEGYMWLSDSPRFTRGRDMEAAVRTLAGEQYAEEFWKKFRERYITRADILRMAEEGYNSVRIPINWRLFMEENTGSIVWKEEGFRLLDSCIGWCREAKIYAFIDLHAAPGGQTGSNIDDCAHDRPELFMNSDYFNMGIALWAELARRYSGEWIVGGYDLLNEPLMPMEDGRYDSLLPELKRFYHEAIAAIRAADPRHMISLEGHHWATETCIFDEFYDCNALIHFHRYACLPEKESIEEFLRVSEKQNMPIWLGETGENKPIWYAAFYPMVLSFGIGYNLWTWKKMETGNSPCSVHKPDGWERLINATKEKAEDIPSPEEVRKMLDAFLDNMLLENCGYHHDVIANAFRCPPCALRAQDYDLRDFSGSPGFIGHSDNSACEYRSGLPISLREAEPVQEKEFFFDTQWDRYTLTLESGEEVSYLFLYVREKTWLRIEGVKHPGCLHVMQDQAELVPLWTEACGDSSTLLFSLREADETRITLKAAGASEAEWLILGNSGSEIC